MNQEFESLIQVLNSPDFDHLARNDSQTPLSWDDLTNCSLPNGWSVRDTYEALFAIRRLHSIYLPKTYAARERRTFYTLSGTFLNALTRLTSLASNDSPLYQQLKQKDSHRFKQKSIYKELSAVAAMDGIEISREKLENLMFSYSIPVKTEEKIVVNAINILAGLEDMVCKQFDEALLRSMYDRLTKNVTDEELNVLLPDDRQGVDLFSDQYFFEYANNETKNIFEPSIVTAIMIREQIQWLRPFPHLNYIMAWILFRLYTFKNNYPVLAYIPAVYTMQQWIEGNIPKNALSFAFSDETDTSPMIKDLTIMGYQPKNLRRFISVQEQKSRYFPDEGDISRYLITNIELFVYAINELKKGIVTGLIDLHQLSLIDTSLNYRQNSVILKAKQNPDEKFYIRIHQKTNGIAYATARADLLELAKKGYLQQASEGKAFYFTAGPKLRN